MALQLSDIMVARLIILLGLRGEGAIDTTMQSEKRMGSANISRGDVRSNAHLHAQILHLSVSRHLDLAGTGAIERRRRQQGPKAIGAHRKSWVVFLLYGNRWSSAAAVYLNHY